MSDQTRIATDVIFEVLEGEAVLLHVGDGTYYRLNRTGTRVWQLLEQGTSRDQIVRTIAAEFDAPETAIAGDVKALLQDLEQHGLIRQAP